MKRLILTTDSSGAGSIGAARLADLVIVLERRLVWGPPLSQAQLDAFFEVRNAVRGSQDRGLHWQDYTTEWRLERSGGKDLSLIEFCSRYDQIELWIDPDPNAQLNLVWLLDFLGAHDEPVSKMKFVQADFAIPAREPEEQGGNPYASASPEVTSIWPALRGGHIARRRPRTGSTCLRWI